MEFDRARGHYGHGWGVISDEERRDELQKANTLMEGIAKTWAAEGYQVPHLIFWNVDARQNNIPMLDGGRVSFVSGFSPSIFQSLMTGKTGYDLMMEVLNKERYACVK
jgi:hypothetical protein